ncbi:hypothetical protein AGLY_007568 [Aphis glycines]|uniref:Uncharacterized protein n=1 Tax=Aphis glycines TaxID=307491 RepID=A0A6G0TMY2_APHGL|nr:hypothetical protein AGLY_007568 [Aphis glycines]
MLCSLPNNIIIVLQSEGADFLKDFPKNEQLEMQNCFRYSHGKQICLQSLEFEFFLITEICLKYWFQNVCILWTMECVYHDSELYKLNKFLRDNLSKMNNCTTDSRVILNSSSTPVVIIITIQITIYSVSLILTLPPPRKISAGAYVFLISCIVCLHIEYANLEWCPNSKS